MTDEWEMSRDRLTLGDKVGEGEFGQVLEAVLLTGKYRDCPLPCILVEHVKQSVFTASWDGGG